MASYYNEKNSHPENILMPADIAIMARIAESEFGHEVALIDTEANDYSLESLTAEIKHHDPDVIAVKGKSPSNKVLLQLFGQPALQGMKFQIIGYGHTFGTNGEFFLRSGLPFYCTIAREPELSFREILRTKLDPAARAGIRGISYREGEEVVKTPDMPLLQNLDDLPSPKYEWFIGRPYLSFFPLPLFMKRKMGFMLASRGCPMKCIYCSPTLRQSSGTGMRFHSVERIVSDMKFIQDNGGEVIMFRDDILTLDNDFVRRMCEGIIKARLRIKWMAQTHINYVNEDLLALMKKAGCVTLAFGLESGSKEILKTIKKFNDLDHARKIFPICKRLGFKTVGFFLVGNPGETLEDVALTRQLIKDLNPDLIQVALFTPYKGSTSYELLPPDERHDEDDFHHYNKITHNFSKIETEVLKDLPKKIYLEYILSPRNVLRLGLQCTVDLFVNREAILKLLVVGSRFLFFRKVS